MTRSATAMVVMTGFDAVGKSSLRRANATRLATASLSSPARSGAVVGMSSRSPAMSCLPAAIAILISALDVAQEIAGVKERFRAVEFIQTC